MEARFGLPTQVGTDQPPTGLLAQMLDHRTYGQFRPQPLAEDLLELLLAATFSTPSKSDLQQCSVVVVRDRAAAKGHRRVDPRDAVDGHGAVLPAVLRR
ncbi:MAG: hypothetical protein GEV08_17360 [Acidimicrobiia bacterium]|nr:hypothetical protein [Acidimicrobiia bacterium]